MQVEMRVHTVATQPVEVEVVYNGETLKAVVPELHVELGHLLGVHGSMVLRYRGKADIEAARSAFVQGQTVMMSFAAAPATVETVAA